MALLEDYIIDADGRKTVVFIDTEKPLTQFDAYQQGYAEAKDKSKFNANYFRTFKPEGIAK